MALAACGGGQKEVQQRTTPGPTIERAVAERLAGRSEQVAQLLDAGDSCGAAAESARLRDELTQAINDRVIPTVYLEDLSGTVNEIQAQIPPCQPPADTKEKKKKKDKHDGEHDGEGGG